MKIFTRRDIDAPAETVFATLTDFARHEAQARSNGIEVTRLDRQQAAAAWRILAEIRGVRRAIEARVVTFDPPGQFALRAEGDGLSALLTAEIEARAPGRSTLHVRIGLTPATLKARLLLQPLTLARGALTGRLDRRLERLARIAEAAS